MEYDNIQYPNALPGYLENQSPKPFYHTNLQNVLEGVSLKPLPQYEKGGLETVFSDKAKSSKAGVKKGLTVANLLCSMSIFHGHTMILIGVKAVERYCTNPAER
jgi:hypothetical protein